MAPILIRRQTLSTDRPLAARGSLVDKQQRYLVFESRPSTHGINFKKLNNAVAYRRRPFATR
jgi:hypothetical protein